MNVLRSSPGSIGSRNSTVMVPGFLRKLWRPQNRPEFSATGTTGTSSS